MTDWTNPSEGGPSPPVGPRRKQYAKSVAVVWYSESLSPFRCVDCVLVDAKPIRSCPKARELLRLIDSGFRRLACTEDADRLYVLTTVAIDIYVLQQENTTLHISTHWKPRSAYFCSLLNSVPGPFFQFPSPYLSLSNRVAQSLPLPPLTTSSSFLPYIL